MVENIEESSLETVDKAPEFEHKKKHEIDMTEGSIIKKMIVFALPMAFASVLQLLFNAADVIVVGRYAGDNSLAAVGSNGSMINLLVSLFTGMSVAANVLCAKFFGAKDKKNLESTVHSAMLLSLIFGVMLAVLGYFIARPILIIMDTPIKVLDLATLYLKIYFLSMPALMVYNFGSAILRAKGDTKRPLYFLAIAGVINVCFNMLFVIVFDMDVAGVGWATVISQYISGGAVWICLMREYEPFKLKISQLSLNKQKVLQLLRIGIPAGLQGSLFSISNMLIQSSVNSFGEVVMAGNAAGASLDGFVWIAMYAISQATISFAGQNIGAGKYKRIPRVLWAGILLATVVGVILGGVVYIFGEPLLGIYTQSAEAISYGMIRLLYLALPYFLCGIMDVISSVIRGMGYSLAPTIMVLIGACGLRVLWILTVFRIPKYHMLETVYVSYGVSWVVTSIILAVFFAYAMRKLRKPKDYSLNK